MRILREVDPNAIEKLLLWETVLKEAAGGAAAGAGGDERGGSSSGRFDEKRLNKLRMRVAQRIKELDAEAVSEGKWLKWREVRRVWVGRRRGTRG